MAAWLCACGGGGGGGGSTLAPTTTPTTAPPTPTPTPVPTAAAVSIPVGAPTTAPLGALAGQTASLTLPATASGTGSVSAQLMATQPAGAPTLQSSKRLPRAIGTSQLTPLLFIALTPSVNLAFSSTPAFTFTFPAGFALASGTQAYIAFYDPTQPAASWQNFLGPGAVSGSSSTGITITFASVARTISFQANQTYIFVLFTTGAVIAVPTPTPSPTATPTPTPSPTPTPTPTPVSQTGYACPTSDGTLAVARGNAAAGADAVRRTSRRPGAAAPSSGLLAVTYDRSTARNSASAIAVREGQLGASLVHSYDFSHTNLITRVISVPSGRLASVAAALRTQNGVRSVAPTGGRRYASAVTQPYFTNDPYFAGFTGGTYREAASLPGQWDMHAIGLEYAFGYSQAGNGSGIVNRAALGSPTVKIAIIDTGEDSLHPELSGGKIVGQGCFITGTNNFQSTSNFSTDPDGHGTDVSGIAAANMNNSFGFVGAGGNVSIYAYRVFPTPDTNCLTGGSTDLRCSATTNDIASAINDAVQNQHVNVISMSLGGGGCTSGVDDDPIELQAIQEAIAANVVVVAASGNDSSSSLAAPACNNGVIAVGATSLDDGQPIGSSRSNHGTPTTPIEYVASYSNYNGAQPANPGNASAWGIVAPGGDPNGDTDPDNLHWIENIWTQTPYTAQDAATCADDYPNSSSLTPPVDCRVLIAGTSMATPHVAGAAALIISVNASYASPTAMKMLLCQTANNISDPHQGCGRLNIYRAMAHALNDPNPP